MSAEFIRCPYCNSKRTPIELSVHIAGPCVFSPIERGKRIVTKMEQDGFDVATASTCIAGYHPKYRRTVFIKFATHAQFTGASEWIQGFLLDYYRCSEILSWLIEDWERVTTEENSDYLEGTLKRFYWDSEYPSASRQNALIKSLAVYDESHIHKVLEMLQNYWKVIPNRVDDSMRVGEDLRWFRQHCIGHESPFQKSKTELIQTLPKELQSLPTDSQVLSLSSRGRITPSFDRGYVVLPRCQSILTE